MKKKPRAVVVGAGHNGLTAAALLARSGWEVDVYEQNSVVGGAATSSAVLGSETIVDHGAAAHPFGVASPVFRSLGIEDYGVEWLHSTYEMAHPLEGRDAAFLSRGLDVTAQGLGEDARAWKALHWHTTKNIDHHLSNILGPMLRFPRYPLDLAAFGSTALFPANTLGRFAFKTQEARALLAGSAVHAITAPSKPVTAAFGLLFGALGMSRGWPVVKGGTQKITDALVAICHEHGVNFHLNYMVEDLRELPRADATILNLTPAQVLQLEGVGLDTWTRRRYSNWKQGVATFKVDYLLNQPVPWQDPRVAQTTTVHVGGFAEEIDIAEKQAAAGVLPQRPFVMVSQQQAADPSRAASATTLWTYAHVPHGYVEKREGEVAALIEAQIERFAPGFKDTIIRREQQAPADLEAWNPNLIGGDIAGGAMSGMKALFRPGVTLDPYRVAPGVFLASSSTPPGAGVHGMPGYWAAHNAQKHYERTHNES